MRRLLGPIAALAMFCVPAATMGSTGTGSFTLVANVPVICKLRFQADVVEQGNGFRLGQVKQYCNSPTGFTVSVDYAPGTLNNTSLQIGNHSIVLDGSGHADVYRENGPQVREYDVIAIPGADGFNSDQLQFEIVAN